MKLVILAGGKGTRLGLDIPKVMVPVDGRPLLERTIRLAAECGFKDVILLAGYMSQAITEQLGDGSGMGVNIEYVTEPEPLGTAGCFRQIRDRLNDRFMVVYGDILMDVDFRAFADFAVARGGAGTLFVHPNDHPFDSDIVETDADGQIVAFHSKPHSSAAFYPNLVSAALYVLDPVALDFIPESGPADWGKDVFPRLARERPVFGYRSCEYARDIGTPERLARAQEQLRSGKLARLALRNKKPALFLDRDGVVNEEIGGVHRPQDVKLLPGAASSIRVFNDAGIPVICVTNQPDLAKGFMSWEDFRRVTGAIDQQLASEAGAYIDDLQVCPHHPERGWPGEVEALKVKCDCRKPSDGMLRKAAAFHNIDLSRSWLVGDRFCDVAAARSAGARSVIVATGHGGSDRAQYSVTADLEVATLQDAAPTILQAMQ
jgi:histidinol-phosphate phosphatase family protein